MNLILFLGSGVSLDSGYPTVESLTNAILNSNTFINEAKFLKGLSEYDSESRLIGSNQYLNDKKIGELYRNTTSYEDLYYLCDEISLFDWGLHNNSMVPAFMESLTNKLANLFSKDSQKISFREIGKLAHDAKRYINHAILEGLEKPVEVKGLALIIELAKSPLITSLNIITLNHDLLVEKLLFENGITFTDGFGSSDGDVRWFEPDKFFSNTKIRLIKLHGSLDWYSFQYNSSETVAKISGSIMEEKKDSNGNSLKLYLKTPKVLSGLNKINFYNSGIYTDIHYHFQKILYENDLMVMSGYGWGDDPINNRLMTWLDRKKNRKLILLHKNPNELMLRSMVFDRDYSNWLEFGKLISIPKWLSETSLKEIMDAV